MSEAPLRVLIIYRYYVSTFVYLPWILTKAQLKVDVVAATFHKIRHSKFVDRFHFVPADTDDDFYQITNARLDTGEYSFLLIIDEPGRRLFAERPASAIYSKYEAVPRDNELSHASADKQLFQAWCEKHGIPIAPTRLPATLAEAIQEARDFGYPVVLKGARGYGGQAVKICRDEEQVHAAFNYFAAHDDVLLQQFITGPVGSVSFVSLRGKVAAWSASEKYIALLGGLGPSAVRRLNAHPELGRITHIIAKAGDITGITGFDWMEVAPGKFVVIDPHFGRCTPPCAIAHIAGVDIGRAVRELIEDAGTPCQEPQSKNKRIIVLFPQIIELLFEGGLWQILTKAFPLAKDVSYYFGPKQEAALSLRVAKKYLFDCLKMKIGILRRKLFS